MRVDVVSPGGATDTAQLRDGEKVEIGEADGGVLVRLRRVSRGHVVLEIRPAAEKTPRERVRLRT